MYFPKIVRSFATEREVGGKLEDKASRIPIKIICDPFFETVKEEILRSLEMLTTDLLDWLERASDELRQRYAPVY